MALAAALLVVVGPVPTVARAQTDPPAAPAPVDAGGAESFTWAVEPSGPEGPGNRDAFVYDVAPGERLVDTVGISNLSTEPLTVSIYAADAYNTNDGGFALSLEDDPQRGIGEWSSLATNIHTIDPRSRVDIPFEINVAPDAEPGDHAGAIIATASDETGTPLRSETVPGSNVTLDRRVAARVYLRVDGPLRPALQVVRIGLAYDSPATPLQRGPAVATYAVQNTGNVRLPLHTELELGGPMGKKLGAGQPRDYPEILPGGTVTIAEPLGDVAPWLRLTGSVTATSGELVVRRSVSKLALPWPTVLLVVALVAFRSVRRRRRAAAAGGTGGAHTGPGGGGGSGGGGPGGGGGGGSPGKVGGEGGPRRRPTDLVRRVTVGIGGRRPAG